MLQRRGSNKLVGRFLLSLCTYWNNNYTFYCQSKYAKFKTWQKPHVEWYITCVLTHNARTLFSQQSKKLKNRENKLKEKKKLPRKQMRSIFCYFKKLLGYFLTKFTIHINYLLIYTLFYHKQRFEFFNFLVKNYLFKYEWLTCS